MPNDGDTVTIPDNPGGWTFTPDVARGFDAHVAASIPFYGNIQDLVAETTDWLAPRGAVIADLGAATGTTAARIVDRHPRREHRFHLYDGADAMLTTAASKINTGTTLHPGPLQTTPFDHPPAALTLALFTLQFVDPAERTAILRKAREASRDDGALILAEKLRLPDSRWAEIGTNSSHDHKARCGVTAPAIRQKERSLRGVLIPWTDTENRRALTRAGWQPPSVLFRWHQWAVYGAFADSLASTSPTP